MNNTASTWFLIVMLVVIISQLFPPTNGKGGQKW